MNNIDDKISSGDFYVECGYTSLNKFEEELCGDKVECSVNGDYTTLVLADGLGSGVKANILSTLTSKILCTMISNGISMEDCIETVIQSLPICKERKIAYSTFTIIHINNRGEGMLIEFDNPQAILFSNGKSSDFSRKKLEICDKTVYVTDISLKENDYIITMSDGTIYAGSGKILNYKWERNEIMRHLERNILHGMSARSVTCLLVAACNDLYVDRPGDDTTVAAVRFRKKLQASVFVGPPIHKDQDKSWVNKFMEESGKKIVCGGTSSKIVAKCLGKPLKSSLDIPDKEIPPIGYIDGIDLTTEGIITLRRLLELSEKYISVSDLTPKRSDKQDGASLLANMLFEEASDIKFFVGQSINVAHQNSTIDITMKLKLIESLLANLRKMGKTVSIQYN